MSVWLKVTYFPAEYIKFKQKKKKDGPVELTFLKSKQTEQNYVWAKKRKMQTSFTKSFERWKIRMMILQQRFAILKKKNFKFWRSAGRPRKFCNVALRKSGEMRFRFWKSFVPCACWYRRLNNSWKLKTKPWLLKPTI